MFTPLICDVSAIILAPFISFVVLILFGKRFNSKAVALISIGGIASSFVFALLCLPHFAAGETLNWSKTFADLGGIQINYGLLYDPVAMMMTLMVSLIATCIQIYSVGYMHGDPRYSRYFAYMSLFACSMLGLVLSSNLFQMIIFWEGMGLCSYLLIGFWYERPSAAAAGKKAFLTTRVGDMGLILGVFLLFATLGHANIMEFGSVQSSAAPLTVICLLLFCGAIGKSAQFPLHVWLPDAMEGPTSVSALIHAATMVVAGVFLVVRTFPLFEASGVALDVVMIIGTITAFMAAFIALTQNDIKKVLAYSTISQLGYMMVALGVGGLSPATFHLMTHAFFKALLFLCSGSVIHGTGTQDMRQMGGLFGKMKITAATCTIGALAISGIPPFAGFWSKDEILATIHHAHHPIIYTIMAITSFMTAFYMFRLIFMTFFGEARDKKVHAHESPLTMTGPLMVLAVFAFGIGLVGSPFMHQAYTHIVHPHIHAHKFDMSIATMSTFIALLGILLAWLLYIVKPELPRKIADAVKPLYTASSNKFWIDELYQKTIIAFTGAVSKVMATFDQFVIDMIVNEIAHFTQAKSRMNRWIDENIVDAFVNFLGTITQGLSGVLRYMQTGFIQNYLLIVIFGLLFILVAGISG